MVLGSRGFTILRSGALCSGSGLRTLGFSCAEAQRILHEIPVIESRDVEGLTRDLTLDFLCRLQHSQSSEAPCTPLDAQGLYVLVLMMQILHGFI